MIAIIPTSLWSSHSRLRGRHEEKAGLLVGEGLRKLMGGVKLCREEELTRAVLLEFLKSQGEIEEVKGLVG